MEGRTSNLGEILLNGTKSKLNATTELQVFALIVTAEPYFAVTRPSDLIVMENAVRPDTLGKIEEVDPKYELLQRGQYQRFSNPLALKMDAKQPLELYEARNAVQIARATGADRFASDTFIKAEASLAAAEAYQARNAGVKPVTMTAREAVQTAEDARAIAVKRQEEAALSAERQQSADRESRAETGRAAAQSEADRVTRDAASAQVLAREESARLIREKDAQTLAAQAEADRIKRDTDSRLAAAAAETDRLKQESSTQSAAALAETNRLKAENASQSAAALAEADRLKSQNAASLAAATAEADRLKRENEEQKAANQLAIDRATKGRAEAEAEKAELRGQLLKQFNAILQTRDTARGLIVNMSDVLFDTAQFSLRPLAREKLAKVVGILSAHPGLLLDIEGHTDSVGTDEYNQRLSEQRGAAVRDYLTQGGISAASVTVKGLGESQPLASNDTPKGRQQNRRVELVISGDSIGGAIRTPVVVR